MAQVDNLLSYRVERTLDSNGQICTTMFLTASAPPPPYFRNDDLSTWALFRNVSSADSTRVSSQFLNCSVTVSRWWSRLLAHRPSVIVSRGWLMLIYFNMTLSGGCVTAERLILNTYICFTYFHLRRLCSVTDTVSEQPMSILTDLLIISKFTEYSHNRCSSLEGSSG